MEAEGQVQDGQAGEVMESMGIPEGESQSDVSAEESPKEEAEGTHSNATLAVQKRLKAQRRAHEREVRDLHARISEMESRMIQPDTGQNDQPISPYTAGQPDIDSAIHKAVSVALQHKEMAERKAHEAEQQAHVNRHYQDFQKHLDSLGDKYDDLHEVIYGDNPYTPAMRDYALTLPRSGAGSAGEVLYKLGKNPEELKRIAKLLPLDQASELAKLSHALVSGGEQKGSQGSKPPLGNIKSNPVTNSAAITDKTPIGSLRERMKSGNWK